MSGPRGLENLANTFCCHYCKRFKPLDKRTRDHVVPHARFGSDADVNLVWACIPCNNRKMDQLPSCHCITCVRAVEHHLQRISVTLRPVKRQRLRDAVDGLWTAYGMPDPSGAWQ